MKKFFSDISLSAVSAGLIAVLVGFASAMAIVFQAAQASGANEQHIVSWVWALGIGMGIGCIWLSVKYKRPIIIAWSTPGAALLATTLTEATIDQSVGIFVFVGALTLIVGILRLVLKNSLGKFPWRWRQPCWPGYWYSLASISLPPFRTVPYWLPPC